MTLGKNDLGIKLLTIDCSEMTFHSSKDFGTLNRELFKLGFDISKHPVEIFVNKKSQANLGLDQPVVLIGGPFEHK